MKCSCSSGLGTTFIAILGVATFGFAGYNSIKTGCPMGSCVAPAKSTTTTVANPDPNACPLTEDGEMSCCPDKSAADRAACCPNSKPPKPEPKKGVCPITGAVGEKPDWVKTPDAPATKVN